jgi:nucleotide-binding universal stress UspA family protein
MGRVVVGVDGSGNSRSALLWALDHARGDDEVVAVHVWDLRMTTGLEGIALDLEEFEAAARTTLHEVVASLDEADAARVTEEVRQGHPGHALIELSEGADLLVVGARGHGGFLALLLGSVSTYAVHHARCPVVVVPVPKV